MLLFLIPIIGTVYNNMSWMALTNITLSGHPQWLLLLCLQRKESSSYFLHLKHQNLTNAFKNLALLLPHNVSCCIPFQADAGDLDITGSLCIAGTQTRHFFLFTPDSVSWTSYTHSYKSCKLLHQQSITRIDCKLGHIKEQYPYLNSCIFLIFIQVLKFFEHWPTFLFLIISLG